MNTEKRARLEELRKEIMELTQSGVQIPRALSKEFFQLKSEYLKPLCRHERH